MNRQTTLLTKETATPRWYVVDAAGQTLGRLSVRLARVLMGKHKALYTPHANSGDVVVVINADKLKLTGSKLDTKEFQTYVYYPSGQKRFTYRWMMEHKPELLLERAVRRMMPRNKMRSVRIKMLKIYRGAEHPHAAQQPVPLPAA